MPPKTKHRRWIPSYAIYGVEFEGERALIVTMGPDERRTIGGVVRRTNGSEVSDEALVSRFTRLARPGTTIEQIARFIQQHGSLSGFSGNLPVEAAERFGQVTASFKELPVKLLAGAGAPTLSVGGDWPIATVSLYQKAARFVRALLNLDSSFRDHGQIPWESYSLRPAVAQCLTELEQLGFHRANPSILAAVHDSPPPSDTNDAAFDEESLHLAGYSGELESLLRSMVETSPGTWERVGPLNDRAKRLTERARAWRAYWADLRRAQDGPPFPARVLARQKKQADINLLESAAAWLLSTARIQAELSGTVGTFKLRYAPATCWQAIALSVAAHLVRSGGQALRGCRVCGSAFTPRIGSSGGRPRTLCEECYDPRTAKTVSERLRRPPRKVARITE